ncbi:MAG TPA: hypothetical protein VGI60_09475 [Chthoniobacterales bacterium]|jgi:hypothetical protein
MTVSITGGDLKPGPTYDRLKAEIEKALKAKKYEVGEFFLGTVINQTAYRCELTARDGNKYKVTVFAGKGLEL